MMAEEPVQLEDNLRGSNGRPLMSQVSTSSSQPKDGSPLKENEAGADSESHRHNDDLLRTPIVHSELRPSKPASPELASSSAFVSIASSRNRSKFTPSVSSDSSVRRLFTRPDQHLIDAKERAKYDRITRLRAARGDRAVLSGASSRESSRESSVSSIRSEKDEQLRQAAAARARRWREESVQREARRLERLAEVERQAQLRQQNILDSRRSRIAKAQPQRPEKVHAASKWKREQEDRQKRIEEAAKERHRKLVEQVEKRNLRRHPLAPPQPAKSLFSIRENPQPRSVPRKNYDESRRLEENRIRDILEERKQIRINHEALRLHARALTRQAKADEEKRIHQLNLARAKLPPPVPVIGKASLLAERRAQYANIVKTMQVSSSPPPPQVKRRVVMMGLELPRAPKSAVQLAAEQKANEYISLRRAARASN